MDAPVRFLGAGKVYDVGQTFLDRFGMDTYSFFRRSNLYYPFASHDDWQVANYLLQSGLSMAKIDEYLKLNLIRTLPLSFQTAKGLRGCAELLPPGPHWNYRIVPTSHPTKNPVILYYHDALDCIESLFNHPYYAPHMDYTPFRLFTTAERIVREYTEWMSAEVAWWMQSKLPEGATLCGVILSSDKTHITNMCGGKAAHPLLISLANIRMAVRNKASSHVFLLLALMPISQFLHPNKRMCSVLDARLFHQCLDIIVEPLKTAARIGRMMSDPRTRATTLAQLARITCDPDDVERYFTQCECFRLSGVAEPFFRDWPLSDPANFFSPEALHHWYGEFWDHDVQWCKNALGSQELDFHYSILQPIVSLRHFKDGITTLKQVTGRAKRDVQRYIVPVIAGAMPTGAAHVLTSSTRDKIKDALAKGAKSGAALDHWQIPKLELMQSVAPSVSQIGVPVQWSADTTEHAHVEVIKDPAASTNHHNFNSQICRYLDRIERCRAFETATRLSSALHNGPDNGQDIPDSEVDLAAGDVDDPSAEDEDSEEHPTALLNDIWAPKRPVPNFFSIAQTLLTAVPGSIPHPIRTFTSGPTAFRLNYDPSIKRIAIDQAAEMFNIPDLCPAIADYLGREGPYTQNFHSFGGQRRAHADVHLPFSEIQVWYKVRLQQKLHHDRTSVGPVFTINAHPANHTWEYGRHDAAILHIDGHHEWPSSGLTGHAIVEICLIMRPLSPRGCKITWDERFLVYAQQFDVAPQQRSQVDPATGLHVLKRATCASGALLGDIFPLDQIRSYAHLVPHFGRAADPRLTSSNSSHFSQSFWLNSYFDKEFYYAISLSQ
ncbi:hypothetical protein EV363DRAFT_1399315 [Boletus edulis]|nr:hypothetical protein EV363DRAFT_1399315 [Boletus edulis]